MATTDDEHRERRAADEQRTAEQAPNGSSNDLANETSDEHIPLPLPFDRFNARCWRVELPSLETSSDGPEPANGCRSPLVLYEDGRPLGPGHAPHDLIANDGGGLYSHWGGALYFSTSDGSHANFNGRHYSVTCSDESYRRSLLHVIDGSDHYQLVTTLMGHSRGNMYTATFPRPLVDSGLITCDRSSTEEEPGFRATVFLYEDGQPLGLPHSVHSSLAAGRPGFSCYEGLLYFCTSDGSDPRSNGRRYTMTMSVDDYVASLARSGRDNQSGQFPHDRYPLVGAIEHREGKAFQSLLPSPLLTAAAISCDDGDNRASTLVAYEDDTVLLPPHADHDDIAHLGTGRYSHWGSRLFFSSSDGTDPTRNGRHYSYTLTAEAYLAALSVDLKQAAAERESLAYRLFGPFRPFGPPAKQAWVATLSPAIVAALAVQADCHADLERSALVLFEDGQPLGPPHSHHDDITGDSGGAYSHWGQQVFFATSDGTSPVTNGRHYAVARRLLDD